MAPHLKLPDNFHVKIFWYSCNSHRVEKLLPPKGSGASALPSALSLPIDISSSVEDEVIVISEMQLLDSLATPPQHQCPSESTMVSPDQSNDGEGLSMQRRHKRAAANTTASSASKKKKVAPSMITGRWHDVWACKYT